MWAAIVSDAVISLVPRRFSTRIAKVGAQHSMTFHETGKTLKEKSARIRINKTIAKPCELKILC